MKLRCHSLGSHLFSARQRSCGKVTFSVVPFCQSICSQGGDTMWPVPMMPFVSHHTRTLLTPVLALIQLGHSCTNPQTCLAVFKWSLTVHGFTPSRHLQTCSLCILYSQQASSWLSTEMPPFLDLFIQYQGTYHLSPSLDSLLCQGICSWNLHVIV